MHRNHIVHAYHLNSRNSQPNWWIVEGIEVYANEMVAYITETV